MTGALNGETHRKVLKTILPEKYQDLCDKTVEEWKGIDEDQSSEFWNSSQEPRIRISQGVARSYG
jgi:hypothetical protein